MYSVSVIMPIYNNEKTLRRAIDSILNQTIFDLELILVNDGSTDASGDICDEYGRKEPLIVEVIHQQHRGLGLARNAGMFKSTGKYIYFANPHHIFNKRMLQDNIQMADDKEAELVVFGFTDETIRSSEGTYQHLPRMPHILKQTTFRNHYRNFHHFHPYELSNKIYRRAYLRQHAIKFYNTSLNVTSLFHLDVYRKLNRVVFNRVSYCTHEVKEEKEFESYNEIFYEVNLKRAQRLQTLLASWGREVEFYDLIVNEYFQAVVAEIEHICARGSIFSTSEQQSKVQAILKDEKVMHYIKDVNLSQQKSAYLKALLMMILSDNSKGVVQVVASKNGTQGATLRISSLFKRMFQR